MATMRSLSKELIGKELHQANCQAFQSTFGQGSIVVGSQQKQADADLIPVKRQ